MNYDLAHMVILQRLLVLAAGAEPTPIEISIGSMGKNGKCNKDILVRRASADMVMAVMKTIADDKLFTARIDHDGLHLEPIYQQKQVLSA